MSPLFRNTLTVLRGSIIGQGIIFLALPWLSRVFGPEAFGVLQSLQALLTLLLIVSSLRLEIAIVSADDADVRKIIPVSIALCLLTSLLTLICLGVLLVARPTVLAPLGNAAFLLPLGVLLAGLGQVINYIVLRAQSFNISANGKIAQSISYTGSASIFGLFWPTVIMLNVADLLGRLALIAVSLRGAVLGMLRTCEPLQRASFHVLHKFRTLPLLSMPSAVINTLGSSFTAVMLLAIFDSREAGNYAMVERLLGAPIAIVGGAASQAFIAALTASGTKSLNRRALFLRIVRSYTLLGLVPMLILVLTAQSLVPWILGPQWQLAGTYLQILAPMFYIALIATPVNMTLVICDRQGWQFIWDTARLVAIAIMWWFVHSTSLDSITAISLYSTVASVFYVIHIVLSYLSTKTKSNVRNFGVAA